MNPKAVSQIVVDDSVLQIIVPLINAGLAITLW